MYVYLSGVKFAEAHHLLHELCLVIIWLLLLLHCFSHTLCPLLFPILPFSVS